MTMSPLTHRSSDMSEPRRGRSAAQILIVDDDVHQRDLLNLMLAQEGFTLKFARSGEAAMAIVDSDPPDLILLDVMMPNMDGNRFALTIRDGANTRHIPVIMISALDDRDARLIGLSAGVVDFHTKPVDRRELCAQIRNLLRLVTVAPPAPTSP